MLRLSRRHRLSANTITTPPSPAPRHLLTDLLKIATYVLILLTIGSTLTARYTIEQTSMEPNFHPGQGVIVSQAERALGNWISGSAYAAHPESSPVASIERGQIVIFYETDDWTQPPLIKRLIGMPGDQVEIRDGAVFVNTIQLPEPYLSVTTTACEAHCNVTLAANEYFFLGDNRPVSRDSRQFGAISGEQLVGRVVLRFWPLDQITLFL